MASIEQSCPVVLRVNIGGSSGEVEAVKLATVEGCDHHQWSPKNETSFSLDNGPRYSVLYIAIFYGNVLKLAVTGQIISSF